MAARKKSKTKDKSIDSAKEILIPSMRTSNHLQIEPTQIKVKAKLDENKIKEEIDKEKKTKEN
jgi:hypothetical protein